jgi:hypothetical protein
MRRPVGRHWSCEGKGLGRSHEPKVRLGGVTASFKLVAEEASVALFDGRTASIDPCPAKRPRALRWATNAQNGNLGGEFVMEQDDFGIEQITQEDRAYNGSRFSEVRDAIFANPYQKVWGRDGESPLPFYKVVPSNVLRGILPFGQPYPFRQACERTVDSHADLRWGPDRRGFRRLIHSNGVCLTGLWEITEETEYSGYFRKNSRALVAARYSAAAETSRVKSDRWRLPPNYFPPPTPIMPSRSGPRTSLPWKT